MCCLLAVGALAVFNLVLVRFIEALVPPLGRFVEIDGLRLHLVDSGEKPGQSEPPLVFSTDWLGQLNHFSYALAARFPERRVVLVDRPGSGYSQRARPQTLQPRPRSSPRHRPARVAQPRWSAIRLAAPSRSRSRSATATGRRARPDRAFHAFSGVAFL